MGAKRRKGLAALGSCSDENKMCSPVCEQKEMSLSDVRICATDWRRNMYFTVPDRFCPVRETVFSILYERQSIFGLSGAVFADIRPIPEAKKPDILPAYAQIPTACFTQLSCYYLHISVGHAEARLTLADGGRGEKVPAPGTSTLALRHTTMHPVGAGTGCQVFVGPKRAIIYNEVAKILRKPGAYKRGARDDLGRHARADRASSGAGAL